MSIQNLTFVMQIRGQYKLALDSLPRTLANKRMDHATKKTAKFELNHDYNFIHLHIHIVQNKKNEPINLTFDTQVSEGKLNCPG